MVDKLELQQVQAASRALIAAVEHAWARDSRRAGRKVEEASAILKQLGVTR